MPPWSQAREAEAAWNERLAQLRPACRSASASWSGPWTPPATNSTWPWAAWPSGSASWSAGPPNCPRYERELAEVRARLAQLAEQQARARRGPGTAPGAGRGIGRPGGTQRATAGRDGGPARKSSTCWTREAGEAQCPLCGQALSDEHRDELAAQFEAEGKALADAHRANTARRREIAAEQQAAGGRELQALDRELAGQPAQQRREAQLEQALAEAQQAAAELETARAEMAEAGEPTPGRRLCPRRAGRAGPPGRRAGGPGLRRRGPRARPGQQVAALAEFEAAHQRLQTALERVDDERAALADLQARQARWQETLADDRAQRDGPGRRGGPPAGGDGPGAGRSAESWRTCRPSRPGRGWSWAPPSRNWITATTWPRSASGTRPTGRSVVEEKAIFDELRLAFGKKGIQAMIIEAAIPEIEYEANRLLARMTDGRMHVRFETQRETLKRRHRRDAGHQHRRRAGHPALRAVLRRRGVSRQFRHPHRPEQAAGPARRRAAPDCWSSTRALAPRTPRAASAWWRPSTRSRTILPVSWSSPTSRS